jgi:hypothetical protein
MNIEELNKTQLLLLTVLVNFVAAIATSVLTVSMLAEAPTTVTQTVNRIVENTIETVTTQVPVGTPIESAPSTEELLTSAVAATNARAVTFHKNANSEALISGVYLPASRAAVTLSAARLPREVVVKFSNGASFEASLSKTGTTYTVYGFSDVASLPSAPAASPRASTDLKQGQTVITLQANGAVATGIVAKTDASVIETSLQTASAGAGAVNLSGELIGINSYIAGTLYTVDELIALLSEN